MPEHGGPGELAELLAADPDDQRRRIESLAPGDAATLVDAIARERTPAAATLLAAIEDASDNPSARKAARRGLHRLRSIGVVPERWAAPAPSEPTGPEAPRVEPDEAWTSSFDPTGSRALWVTGERALGGIWLAGFILNDRAGMRALELIDSTRKRFRRDLDEWRRDPYGTWVQVPADYALRLIREGVDLARASGNALPTSYGRFRELFGELECGPERPIAFETVSPAEAAFNPDWLTETHELVHEREVAVWRLDPAEELRRRALSVAEGKAAPIVVPGSDPPSQAWQIVVQSAEQNLTPEMRQGLRRRLEETAYIFLQTDRLRPARLAVAGSRALSDPSVPLVRQPLPLELALNGFLWALRAETVDGLPAAEEFYELAQDGGDAAEVTGAPTTTSSGLILPGR